MKNVTYNHQWMIKTAAACTTLPLIFDLIIMGLVPHYFLAFCLLWNMSTQPIMISSKISSNVMRAAAVLILHR